VAPTSPQFASPLPALWSILPRVSRRGVASKRHIAFDRLKRGALAEINWMKAARFCSECGDRLKVKRPALLPLRAFCPRCSPRFRTIRLVFAAALVLATIAFAVSRFGARRELFHSIGTPLEPIANGSPSTSATPVESARPGEHALKTTDSVVGICGAPTRSGKPCQRKVRGGGYCWQHRDKSVGGSSTARK